jgi:hypothetical protein
MSDQSIGETLEEFARKIIEEACEEDVLLAAKLEAFKVVTAYFVGIHKAGAAEAGKPVARSFEDMKKDMK